MKTVPPMTSTATLRVVQGNADAQTVNVVLDGTVMSSNVPYLSSTSYLSVPAGVVQLDVQVPPPNVSPVHNVSVDLAANSHNTFIMDGCCSFSHSSILLMDDMAPSPSGGVKLRIVDAALSSTALDFFVLPSGSTPSGAPTVSAMAFNNASSYLALTPGTYDIFVTATPPSPGPPGPTLFHTGPIILSANQNRTVAVLNLCSPGSCDMTGHTLTSVTLADLN
ncbi:MAG: DUF4397 domain-containing protein [Acidobacteriia bacterium]|nr:DUF4397 domain-containing protein [Terriglobia bacterium]